MALVRLYAAARAATGVSEAHLDVSSLGELQSELIAQFPAIAPVLTKCSYLINELSQRDAEVEIQPGDIVDVLPPFAGGSQ
jgi:molybdopterin converting factor small subunit